MKWWLVLLSMVLAACEQAPHPQSEVVPVDRLQLLASRDEKRGVTCYRIEFQEGLSCVRDVPDGGR